MGKHKDELLRSVKYRLALMEIKKKVIFDSHSELCDYIIDYSSKDDIIQDYMDICLIASEALGDEE